MIEIKIELKMFPSKKLPRRRIKFTITQLTISMWEKKKSITLYDVNRRITTDWGEQRTLKGEASIL